MTAGSAAKEDRSTSLTPSLDDLCDEELKHSSSRESVSVESKLVGSDSDEDVPNLLLDLPVEVTVLVLSLVDNHVDLCHLAQVCRALEELCSDDHLWRVLYQQRWRKRKYDLREYARLVQVDEVSWRQLYRDRHCFLRDGLNDVSETVAKKLKEHEEALAGEVEKPDEAEFTRLNVEAGALFEKVHSRQDRSNDRNIRLSWMFVVDHYEQAALTNVPGRQLAILNWGLALWNLGTIYDQREPIGEVLFRMAFDRFAEATEIAPESYATYMRWGKLLRSFAWRKRLIDPQVSIGLYDESCVKFREVVDMTHGRLAIAFTELGASMLERSQLRFRVLRQEDLSLSVTDPRHEEAGLLQPEQAITYDEIWEHIQQANEYFEMAIQRETEDVGRRAVTLNHLGLGFKFKAEMYRWRYSNEENRDESDEESPTSESDYINVLTSMFRVAFRLFSRADHLKESFFSARYNLASSLFEFAKSMEKFDQPAALQLLNECCTQYKHTLEIESDQHTVCNLGICALACCKLRLQLIAQFEEKHPVLDDTLGAELYQMREELLVSRTLAAECFMDLSGAGVRSYNMACLAAIFEDRDECVKWLTEASAQGYLRAGLLECDSDFDRVRSCEWFQRFVVGQETERYNKGKDKLILVNF